MSTLTTPTTGRYSQLLASLPVGRFYDASGYIIPYRSDAQQFRFETGVATRTYGLFINSVYSGITTTDALGVAIITVSLRQGRNDIQLVDEVTQAVFKSYVDARRIATWYASYAEVIEALDAENEDIYNARSLETVSAAYAENTYGRALTAPNDSGYSNLSYVNALQELRQAYRAYGGMPRGLRSAVGAFTSTAPLAVPSTYRPTWILGYDFAPNGQLHDYARTTEEQQAIAGLDLPEVNIESLSYIKDEIFDDAIGLTYSATNQPPAPQPITVSAGAAWAGGDITITGTDSTSQIIVETLTPVLNDTVVTTLSFASITSIAKELVAGAGDIVSIGTAESRFVKMLSFGSYNAKTFPLDIVYIDSPDRLSWAGGTAIEIDTAMYPDGVYTLHDIDRAPSIWGIPQSPYNLDPLGLGVVAHQVDQLYIRTDEGLLVRVDLKALAPITAATAADIVTAIGANASVITGDQGVNGDIVKIFSTTLGVTGRISLEPGPADAGPIIFGAPRTLSTLDSPAAVNDTSITLVDASRFPDVDTSPVLVRISEDATAGNTGIGFLTVTSTTALGLGQLRGTYTTDNAYLQYASPGDTLGAQVDAKAGGSFTLTSANLTDTLTISAEAAALNPSSSSTVIDDVLQIYVPGEYEIRIRGRRASAIDGVVSGTTTYATFGATSPTFSAADVGGAIRISNASSGAGQNNNGIHPIVAFINSTSVTIHNQRASTNTVFANEAGIVYSLWSPGEEHAVTSKSGNVLELNEPITLVWPGNEAVYVEMAVESPVSVQGIEGPGTLIALVDPTFLPPVPETSTVTLEGSDIPDGWFANTTNPATVVDAEVQIPAYLDVARTILSTTDTNDLMLYRSIPGALAYVGLPLRATFWVSEHSAATGDYRVDVSTDNGTTWLTGGSTTTIDGIVMDTTDDEGSLLPSPVTRTFYIPQASTGIWVRLVRVSAGENPLAFSIHRIIVDSLQHTALFLGTNTIPRSNQNANFGELIYVWSPEPLLSTEDNTLGLPLSRSTSSHAIGQIDLIMPAHETVARFDISEYDVDDLPINVVGIYTDNDWAALATLTNMEVVIGTPAKQTYVRPTRVSLVEAELLAFIDAGGGSVDSTTLTETTAYEGATPPGDPDGSATLLEVIAVPQFPGDIKVVPDTIDASSIQPWNWIVGNAIHVDAAYYDATAQYALNYNAMIRADSGTITLPVTSMDDYLWLIDAAVYQRTDLIEGNDPQTEQLAFGGAFTATLSSRSDQNLATSTLIADNGLMRTTLAQADWSYVDSKTVQINSSVFDSNSLYSFSYTALYPRIQSPAQFVLEWRSADTEINLASADWQVVTIGEAVNPIDVAGTYNQFHQVRATISGVVDVRDIRIYGIGLKGIHLYGSEPYAPGIVL